MTPADVRCVAKDNVSCDSQDNVRSAVIMNVPGKYEYMHYISKRLTYFSKRDQTDVQEKEKYTKQKNIISEMFHQ